MVALRILRDVDHTGRPEMLPIGTRFQHAHSPRSLQGTLLRRCKELDKVICHGAA